MPDADATTALATAPATPPLPDGWRWARLGDVISSISNGTTTAQNFEGRGIPVTRIETISSGAISSTRIGWLDVDNSEIERYILKPNDILFSHINSVERVGNCAIYQGQPPVLVHGMNLLRIIVHASSAQPQYIFWYLRSEAARYYYAKNARRAIGQASLNTKDIREFPIPLPPLAEQRRIAAILAERMAAVERARAAAEAQLAAAKALPAAELRAVFESNAAQAWPRERLEDVCSIDAPLIDPTLPEFADMPHVNGENIESGTGKLLYLRSAAEEGMMSGKYLFKPGDVLYSKLRPYLRKVTAVDFAGVCSADMYPITTRPNTSPQYLAWLLLSEDFTAYADAESRRARMPKINREQLMAWLGPFPDLIDQQCIAARLDARMADIAQLHAILEAQRDAINALPAALLRQAFTGEL